MVDAKGARTERPRSLGRLGLLVFYLPEGDLHWLLCDLEETAERALEFEDEEDGTGDGEGGEEEGDMGRGIGRCKEREGEEDDEQPGDDDDEQRGGDRGSGLDEQKGTDLIELDGFGGDLGFEHLLEVVGGLELLDGRIESGSVAEVLFREFRRGVLGGPKPLDGVIDDNGQFAADRFGFGAVVVEKASDEGEFACHVGDFGGACVVGTLCRGDEESEEESRHGGDETYGEFDRVFCVGTAMMFWNAVADEPAEQHRSPQRGEDD